MLSLDLSNEEKSSLQKEKVLIPHINVFHFQQFYIYVCIVKLYMFQTNAKENDKRNLYENLFEMQEEKRNPLM